jgi:toxin ParE1/3/4
MAWKIIFSARSRNDLQKIVDYIARDNAAAAGRFGSLLITQAESLENAPEMGPTLPQRPGARFFPVGRYLIIYRLDTKRQVVRILRFWHSARRKRPAH